MKQKPVKTVYLVDDEQGIRETASSALEKIGCRVECFDSAESCLEKLRKDSCHLLITDVRMPKTDGLTLLKEAKDIAPWVSVLLITGYGDVPMATKAMKSGAVDFIEKPLERTSFVQRVKSILEKINYDFLPTGGGLTNSEFKVLKLLLEGKSNKEISRMLSRSVRTVEVHRSHIMRKFNADNIVELVKKASPLIAG